MADNTLPPEGLSGAAPAQPDLSQRRAFLRRAVAVGVPVVLATVRGRSVLAQELGPNETLEGSGCASLAPSGWLQRDPDPAADLARVQDCTNKGYLDENGNPTTPPDPASSVSDPLIAPVEEQPGGTGTDTGAKKQ